MKKPETSFDEEFLRDGFLAKYPPEELAHVRSHASDAFDFAGRLNKRLMVIMRGLKPRRQERGEILGMLLFLKALNAFQGGVLLCQRGLLVESQNLARLALECTIHLMALTKEPSHIEAMLADYDRHKKTHAEKLLEHHRNSGSNLTRKDIEALEKLTELEGSSIKLEQLARRVGLSAMYDSIYRGTSGYAAHPTLGALQQLLGEKEGEDVNIIFGGELSGMRHSLVNLLIPMVDLIEPLSEIFKAGFGSDAFKWAAELSVLCGAELVKFDFKKHIT
ncbi:DUF5677 domain-containing protein [Variovorax paradoxus]|uniref:DUF5677 domain-containing protein n=1 Tax=Variovorax paradoxus TaxID=34073 RepID=UPI003ECF8C8E